VILENHSKKTGGLVQKSRLYEHSFEEHFGNHFKPLFLNGFLLTCKPFLDLLGLLDK